MACSVYCYHNSRDCIRYCRINSTYLIKNSWNPIPCPIRKDNLRRAKLSLTHRQEHNQAYPSVVVAVDGRLSSILFVRVFVNDFNRMMSGINYEV